MRKFKKQWLVVSGQWLEKKGKNGNSRFCRDSPPYARKSQITVYNVQTKSGKTEAKKQCRNENAECGNKKSVFAFAFISALLIIIYYLPFLFLHY